MRVRTYPDLDGLKKLYPHVTVGGITEEAGLTYGFTVYWGKLCPYVRFHGRDADDLFNNILRVHHWEEDKRGLDDPIFYPKKEKPAPVAVVEETDADEAETVHGNAGLVWVVNDETVERYRVKPELVAGYIQRGFVKGKKFGDNVSPSRIKAFAEQSALRNREKLYALAGTTIAEVEARKAERALKRAAETAETDAPKQHAMIGRRWIKEIATNVRSRVDADTFERLTAAGTHCASGPRS